jgi:hypothetical protein
LEKHTSILHDHSETVRIRTICWVNSMACIYCFVFFLWTRCEHTSDYIHACMDVKNFSPPISLGTIFCVLQIMNIDFFENNENFRSKTTHDLSLSLSDQVFYCWNCMGKKISFILQNLWSMCFLFHH